MKRIFLALLALAWVGINPANAAITIEASVTAHPAGPSGASIQAGPITTTAGDTIVVIGTEYTGTSNPFATNQFSTGAVNTFTPVISPTSGTGTNATTAVWACTNCNAETANNVVLSVTGGASNYLSVTVIAFKGVPTSNSIDLKETKFVTPATASPSFATAGTTAQAYEYAIGIMSVSGTSGAVIEDPAWTFQSDSYNIASVIAQHVATKLYAAPVSPTYNPSTGSSIIENMQIVTVKDSNPGGATAHNLMLMGVGK